MAYPALLAALCTGAGLAADRAAGGWLPGPLLPVVGAAALIALSQLSTFVGGLAPATPYLMLALALAGLALGAARVRALRSRGAGWRRAAWIPVAVVAYALALAPVLASGRATFSSYMALADSAVHMLGADYLLRHGQHYTHLDLRNSYGRFISAYYGSGYPSGADTLFGASAKLLGAPLIWAFQPFNAFMLATASGPAWLLARRGGLRGSWAALAALAATLPALVYGYELLGSVKEISALPMIIGMGALVMAHERWLRRGPRAAIPFALLAAGGVSALGAGFGPWALASALALAPWLAAAARAGPRNRSAVLALVAGGLLAGALFALPTLAQLSKSVRVAHTIAGTSNPGNLHSPLHAAQALGVWLRGSYKQTPVGVARVFTDALIALALAAAALGGIQLLRRRAFAPASWVALMLVVWLAASAYATTWVQAKGLMLVSPIVVLLAWWGVGALREAGTAGRWAAAGRWASAGLALALSGGVLASDLAQYHSSNLAPTARYEELASLDHRFAGRGPALVSDFDEYALYELRDLDVGGPDFASPPPALAGLAAGYGAPVLLDRAPPRALGPYPLIVTRREPNAVQPPAAYRLIWQGDYYRVWARTPRAAPALAHVILAGSLGAQCARIGALARAGASGARLAAALAPALVPVSLARSSHPRAWGHQRAGLVMSRPGTLSASFTLAAAGRFEVWLAGQIMPAVRVSVDGRGVGWIAGQLGGNSLVPDTMTPLPATLAAGAHRITVTRQGLSAAPGDGGSAVLDAISIAPAGARADARAQATVAGWRTLCGRPYSWVELLRA